MFSRFNRILDRQTDGRIDGHLATAQPALCIASRGKNHHLLFRKFSANHDASASMFNTLKTEINLLCIHCAIIHSKW